MTDDIFKGHDSLADMVRTHTNVWRALMSYWIASEDANVGFYAQELKSLQHIEAACDAVVADPALEDFALTLADGSGISQSGNTMIWRPVDGPTRTLTDFEAELAREVHRFVCEHQQKDGLFKGHVSLADMVESHIGIWRINLLHAAANATDEADRLYYDHEINALNDIESACEVLTAQPPGYQPAQVVHVAEYEKDMIVLDEHRVARKVLDDWTLFKDGAFDRPLKPLEALLTQTILQAVNAPQKVATSTKQKADSRKTQTPERADDSPSP